MQNWAVQRLRQVSLTSWKTGEDSLPSHVVAALLQFHYSPAVVASLPALVFCHLHKTVRLLVFGALSPCVKLAVAKHAHFGVASAAASVLASVGCVHAYLRRLDPFATSFSRAVETVRRRIFLVFLVPEPLELVVEETVHIFQGYVLGSAAGRGHVLGIANGEGKLALEARMTHTVSAA